MFVTAWYSGLGNNWVITKYMKTLNHHMIRNQINLITISFSQSFATKSKYIWQQI